MPKELSKLVKAALAADLTHEDEVRAIAKEHKLDEEQTEALVATVKLLGSAGEGAQAALAKVLGGKDDDEGDEGGEPVAPKKEDKTPATVAKSWIAKLFGKEPEAEPIGLPEGTDEVTKALFEAQVQAQGQIAQLAKQLEDTKAQLDAARAATEGSAHIAKAREITGQASGAAVDKVAKALSAAAKLGTEEREAVEETLRSSFEATRKAASILGASFGVEGGASEGTAYAAIEKRAAELRKSDSKLTREQAIAKVLKEEPKLYAQWREEQAGR